MTTTALLISIISMEVKAYDIIVADSATHVPLPNASIYDKDGTPVAISNSNGALPRISQSYYPITVRYLGFNERTVLFGSTDTIFLSENVSELPEVVIESRRQRMLHILAYVREYSSLSTYTDTVFLFREKMVDYMLPAEKRTKFKGWTSPRVLTSKSYYRFTNQNGLDSVSDVSQHHFSWSDWIGIPPKAALPQRIKASEIAADTLFGKYSPTETWTRINDSIRIDIDVLADTLSRKWVPDFAGFFRKNLDYEKFKLNFDYSNIAGDTVSALDLDRYSFSVDSRGRGRDMFQFNRINDPVFVSTHADVYVLDKEYISVKEARKWDKRNFATDEIGIYEPMEAPALAPAVEALIARINLLNKDEVRLNFTPDHRLMSHNNGRKNFKIGRRALFLLKQLTGITLYKSHKNFDTNWKRFTQAQLKKNRHQPKGE